MTEEDELRLQIRVYAVEILAINLLATSCLQASSDPSTLIATVRQQMLQGAKVPFPGIDDPALSDMLSGELESAVDRLMEMGTAQINAVLEARKKKTGGA
jgi:hypothetical protein